MDLVVDVAEGEPKLERQRNKRQPRPDPPLTPKPAHPPKSKPQKPGRRLRSGVNVIL